MKFSIAAATALFAALTTALPEAFTLVADGGNTVLTDGRKSSMIVDRRIREN